MTNTPNPITVPDLASDKISHGFFTREGGVSTGIYAG
ncbi:MAG: polyphenol oxidase, partial [Pseudomonadota bacterium]